MEEDSAESKKGEGEKRKVGEWGGEDEECERQKATARV